MLTRLIRFSLRNRLGVLALAALLLVYGGYIITRLPIDVFPDLNRPTVTLMIEAPGLAPEEVESLISLPLETALSGAPGVQRVRANCAVGLSIIYVEFDWGQDIYRARQLVQERVELARGRLPLSTEVHMGPISSLMGEIMLIGLSVDVDNPTTPSPPELRTLADWQLSPRLLTLSGVSQVIVIGGGRQQIHIDLDPQKMAATGLSFEAAVASATAAQGSSGGGFLIDGPREKLIRNLARSADPEALARSVVRPAQIASQSAPASDGAPVSPLLLGDIAQVRYGIQPMRGQAGVNAQPAVILGVQKQPGADTTELTRRIEAALDEMRGALPQGVRMDVLFRQASFIETAIANVKDAIRDGSIMVVLILLLFLLNFRTTLITLTAIPLSFAVAAIAFHWLGISINTMTLGGLAVAVGLVVDDAIVDVENVFRRLREYRHAQAANAAPDAIGHAPAATAPNARRPKADNGSRIRAVIAAASIEVRASILLATLVIVLVFLPLFALSGIEGQFFAPIGIAIIVAMLASFLVSLTVIPSLCSYLLPQMKRMQQPRDAWFVRALKRGSQRLIITPALRRPWLTIGIAFALVVAAASLYPRMGKSFLPEFNEGTATVALIMPPGTSLEESDRMGRIAEKLLLKLPEIELTGRRTGRAELDEHAEGVHRSEIDVDISRSVRRRAAILADIRETLAELPGVLINVGQPISHRLDHMLSGVQAAIAVKISGPDLTKLRAYAAQAEAAMQAIPGLVDLQIEKQVLIPQVQIQIDRERAAQYGLRPGELSVRLEAGLNGRVIGQVLDGPRSIDLVLRFGESAANDATAGAPLQEGATPGATAAPHALGLRSDMERLRGLLIDTPLGGAIPLAQVADIREARGPNAINREDAMRRIVVSANVAGRDLDAVVGDIQRTLASAVPMEKGYFISYEGQFQSQQAAARRIGLLAILTLATIWVLLYAHFHSGMIVWQVLLNVPLSFVGALALSYFAVGSISIATLVGLITLAGIATRNTIMMVSHYLHLMQHEGEVFGPKMILRGTLERLVPVTMTALSAGLALIPLAISAHEPGKEILYPVAIVILGGLFSSTLLDMAVTPAVFLKFGQRAAARALQISSTQTND